MIPSSPTASRKRRTSSAPGSSPWAWTSKRGSPRPASSACCREASRGPRSPSAPTWTPCPSRRLADVPFKSLNPAIMHAAGHDIHTAIVLGTAFVLNELKDRIKGNIKFIFQPAGEGAAGRRRRRRRPHDQGRRPRQSSRRRHLRLSCLARNPGPGLHRPGPLLANSDSFQITIKGKSAQGSPAAGRRGCRSSSPPRS